LLPPSSYFFNILVFILTHLIFIEKY